MNSKSTRKTGQTEALFEYVPAFSVRLVRERDLPSPPITSPADVARFLCTLLGDADRECFVAVWLAASGTVIGVNVVSVGTLDASLVNMREVFKGAILANAHSMICAHPHPSGNLEPSAQDVAVTRQLVEAGRLLGIHVRDHVVVGHSGRYTSLAERGLM